MQFLLLLKSWLIPHGGCVAFCVPFAVSQYGLAMQFVSSSSVVVTKFCVPCLGMPKVLCGIFGVYLMLFFHIGMGVILNKSILCFSGCSGFFVLLPKVGIKIPTLLFSSIADILQSFFSRLNC